MIFLSPLLKYHCKMTFAVLLGYSKAGSQRDRPIKMCELAHTYAMEVDLWI